MTLLQRCCWACSDTHRRRWWLAPRRRRTLSTAPCIASCTASLTASCNAAASLGEGSMQIPSLGSPCAHPALLLCACTVARERTGPHTAAQSTQECLTSSAPVRGTAAQSGCAPGCSVAACLHPYTYCRGHRLLHLCQTAVPAFCCGRGRPSRRLPQPIALDESKGGR